MYWSRYFKRSRRHGFMYGTYVVSEYGLKRLQIIEKRIINEHI